MHEATKRVKAALATRYQDRNMSVPIPFRERPIKTQMTYLLKDPDTTPPLALLAAGEAQAEANRAMSFGPETFQPMFDDALSAESQQAQQAQQAAMMAQDPEMAGMDPAMAGMGGMGAGMDPMMAGMMGGAMPPGAAGGPGGGAGGMPGGLDPMALMAMLSGA